ncbi:choice-of-anchor M domain-containing protein [Schaalia sp. Marseille-Q2122]|uniref:choice-of-anchor M domain-containing protein n=1 Tax=Schaalia sp. Marseille-Q2122 TaxID=2736604 RepID=UPI00158DB57E|nr:choice-of-anchor M domain-containing protein [Schaalia sp. Marseille-Q2122]
MRFLPRLSAAVTILVASLAVAPAALADDDPNLAQSVSSDEAQATGQHVIERGHVDVGPRVVDGEWMVMARDDSGTAPVWRDPQEVVLRVGDASKLAAPTESAYAFMEGKEGQEWYIIPQTENHEVVWLGWNTQDPEVTRLIERGATMSIGPVEGPGRSWMFLQDGTFGEPRLLVDGQKKEAQDVWVDVNTHVHANWVFTDPGVYTAALRFSAKTTDGQEASASTTLRFAVGDETSVDEAFAAAEVSAPAATVDAGQSAAADEPASSAQAGGVETASYLPLIVLAIAAVAVIGGALAIMRSRVSARERALAMAEVEQQEAKK